jgi:predicted nucleic acid-binding protein
MSMHLFVDASVFVYLLGQAHPYKAACTGLVAAAERGEVELHASVEMIQELAFHRMRMTDRVTAIGQARDAAALCVLRAFDGAVLDKALELTATTAIGGRDAVHAATALLWGFDAIVSPDRDFDEVPGLRRLDPADALG